MCNAKPRLLRVAATIPDPVIVANVVEALRAGQLVVLPTDTVYGLACRADSAPAVTALYAAKGRTAEKALPILIADAGQLAQVCDHCPPTAMILAEQFWPGPLTMVLRKSSAVPDLVTGGQPTVGVRVPDCQFTRHILAAGDLMVSVTSANLSGEAPALAITELSADLMRHIALIIDAGPCPGGKASTVLDLTSDPPRLLREGPISSDQLSKALGRPVTSIEEER